MEHFLSGHARHWLSNKIYNVTIYNKSIPQGFFERLDEEFSQVLSTFFLILFFFTFSEMYKLSCQVLHRTCSRETNQKMEFFKKECIRENGF